MCHYQTLYYDDVKGYVIYCRNCNSIQLAFGNVMLTLFREDFYGFHECINRIKEEHKDYADCPKKFIVVGTPCEGIKLLVSGIELCQLQGMLDEAETELQSQELLGLFNNNISNH